MSTRTTNLGPRLSLTTTLADAGPQHLYLTSTTTFENDGRTLIDGLFSSKGTMQLGTNGFSFAGLRSSIASVLIATDNLDSVTTDVPITGIASGDPVLVIQPDVSKWSGAYYDISLYASCSSGGVATLAAVNSTNTAVTTDALNFTFYWLDLA